MQIMPAAALLLLASAEPPPPAPPPPPLRGTSDSSDLRDPLSLLLLLP